ncbi:MAG TPA: hypothetical protein VLC55_14775 [Burkholderiales bacterium]|nr:hypothetical protein [Burkholderiales bacterium]
MKRGNAILLAASVAGVGAALWAGAVRADDRDPAERAPGQQVVVQVNAPVQGDDACRHRGAYRDCAGCYSPYGTSVTVLDAPFQPGAMYFVTPAPVAVRHGRWR